MCLKEKQEYRADDDELIEVLSAISVASKRLAKKIDANTERRTTLWDK